MNLDFSTILANLKRELGFEDYGGNSKLADYFGVHRNIIANWKTRDTVDLKLLASKLTPRQFVRVVYGEDIGEQSPAEAKARIVLEDILQEKEIKIESGPQREVAEKLIQVLAKGMAEERKSLAEWRKEALRLFEIGWGE